LLKHDDLADQVKKQTRKPTLKLTLTLKREVPSIPFSKEFCLSTLHKSPLEITARITSASFAIPDVMKYTKIVGMPLVTVIHTILLPSVDFTIFGLSRHLAVGADSTTSAIIVSELVAIAIPDSSKYVKYAGMIALLAATLLLLKGLLHLYFFVDFLSHTI
jgi:MFS superfamily sulfate permease-like transporter